MTSTNYFVCASFCYYNEGLALLGALVEGRGRPPPCLYTPFADRKTLLSVWNEKSVLNETLIDFEYDVRKPAGGAARSAYKYYVIAVARIRMLKYWGGGVGISNSMNEPIEAWKCNFPAYLELTRCKKTLQNKLYTSSLTNLKTQSGAKGFLKRWCSTDRNVFIVTKEIIYVQRESIIV